MGVRVELSEARIIYTNLIFVKFKKIPKSLRIGFAKLFKNERITIIFYCGGRFGGRYP